jgi:hypothetical protein
MKIEYTFAFLDDNLMACQPLIRNQCALIVPIKLSALSCFLFEQVSRESRRTVR